MSPQGTPHGGISKHTVQSMEDDIRERPKRPVATPTILDLVPSIEGFPAGSAGKESACNVGDFGSTPGLGRSLEKGKATHSSTLVWRIPWTE